MKLTDPKVMYADIMIALAQIDETVDDRERRLLDGMLLNMGLDARTIEKLWLTPRTMDVVQSMLGEISDEHFKRCLVKDCFLLAFADEDVKASESRFIKRIAEVMELEKGVLDDIREGVEQAVEHRRRGAELFGEEQE